ncbi:inorganic phosphate transporter [Nisaea acidiphila]|uniref:Phosphate transporter n=1 Tax=Nisaea acidiphila TaxID=1862145 RepID=A0A9J7AZ56_9PROT|nr:inorganic phosphate transporter [Nisaea acidiphila]UUX51713.1 inorganic phosphate transporter [Nisaea acidiphila]
MPSDSAASGNQFGRLLFPGGPKRPPVLPPVQLALVSLALACAAALLGYVNGTPEDAALAAFVALLGAYMAANIGANDVANSVAPLVGARVLPLGAALLLAAGAEVAGALFAGDQIVGRIAFRIVDPDLVRDPAGFVYGMAAALTGAALWVNAANLLRAPISTTHAIIGGIVGVGLFALGASAINWPEIAAITLGWFVSPVASALAAIAILAFVKRELLGVQDKLRAARTWIPILIATMAALFVLFLIKKGLANVWQPAMPVLVTTVLAAFAATMALAGPYIRRTSMGLANKGQTVRVLFRVPLIAAGGFIAFAHGANDIANIAGPVTAILHVQATSDLDLAPGIPFWVFLLGALGIAAGLLLFGGGMVRLVATRITKINPIRAYAVAMATAATVTAASWIGLPVSTTQIAVGAIFGIGIYRELRAQKDRAAKAIQTQKRPRRLFRRGDMLRILIAWTITFPASALISGLLYWIISLSE